MESPNDKNFNLFISLLLEGYGLVLFLAPDLLGVDANLYLTGYPAFLGMACFALALSLQTGRVWKFKARRELLIRGLASVAMMFAAALTLRSGQFIGAAAVALAGMTLGITTLMRATGNPISMDLTRLTASLISFMAGIILATTGLEYQQTWHPLFALILAAGFILTAFLGGITIAFPTHRMEYALSSLQAIPWTAFSILAILHEGSDNLIAPAAIVAMLLSQRLIRWERIVIPETDVLSRRMVSISFVSEIALLTFLGALLFNLDPLLNLPTSFLSAREASLLFFLLFSSMVYYAVTTVIMTTNGLMTELTEGESFWAGDTDTPNDKASNWSDRLERYVKPFVMTPKGIRGRIQADQIALLAKQTAAEKKQNAQLTLLLELSQHLESQFDQPVSAQLTVNTLERALNCSLVTVFQHNSDSEEFILIASAGRHNGFIRSEHRQNAALGVLGRAHRQRKTQIVNDTRVETNCVFLEKVGADLSAVIIPLIMHGHITGIVTIHSEKINSFNSIEISMAEKAAAELARAWDRSAQHHRLMELVQTGSQLTSALDPEMTAREVAWSSREILQAKFTHIYMQLGQERNLIQQASSGKAHLLFESLTDALATTEFTGFILNAIQPFRIRDVRKYEKTSNLKLDAPSLRSLLVIPIRWHQVNIGAIFAFGKQNETFFTENDESLAELISIQAAGAFESAWLQQELRSSLRIASLLYRLSNQIIQAENIEDAASDIAQTAHKLTQNLSTGIVLLDQDHSVLAEVLIDEEGRRIQAEHPISLILEAVASGQVIYISQEQSIQRACLPIQTPIRSYGAIWMDSYDDPAKTSGANPNDLQALVNQAAIALERSLLLVESRRQAKEIKAAYDTLATTYDQTLASLTSALDARDRETEGHSSRVTRLAVRLGESLGYPQDQLKILERGALLHDIGKIGISDTILHKPGPLTEDEWKIMKLHPDIGAKIVNGIPFLEDTITVIRFHQERWDGSGYPEGLKGSEIPELARLFAVVDTFDALTSKRPYRQKISQQEALDYIKGEAGKLFDPEMVAQFEKLILGNPR